MLQYYLLCGCTKTWSAHRACKLVTTLILDKWKRPANYRWNFDKCMMAPNCITFSTAVSICLYSTQFAWKLCSCSNFQWTVLSFTLPDESHWHKAPTTTEWKWLYTQVYISECWEESHDRMSSWALILQASIHGFKKSHHAGHYPFLQSQEWYTSVITRSLCWDHHCNS